MKKRIAILLFFLVCVSAFAQVVLPEKRNYSFAEVYDVFVPSRKSEYVDIWVDGDVSTGRVSFIQGKNPMTVPDAKGKLLEPDPKFKTVYCSLNYSGGEESRSFHLYGRVKISSTEWTRIVATFKPRRNGKIRLHFGHEGNGYWWYETRPNRTQSYYPNVAFADYCKISGENLPINGFKLGGDGWGGGRLEAFSSRLKAEMKSDSSAPYPQYLRTLFGFDKTLNVKGSNDGKIVCTLIFYVRGDDIYNSKY